MFGLKTRDDANTKSIVQLITTEYNFKNIFSLKTKQRIPANKKSTELVNGRQSSTFFSEFESVLILPEELKKMLRQQQQRTTIKSVQAFLKQQAL